ncbi:MAG: MFS transporter [Bryobacterales bacterium]|jgi:MFS transporter, ACS family, hexuronate transporter|nr:MFS transporter [Bryobacterales bacterium]
MPTIPRRRWLVVAVFLLSTSINFLDRQTLVSVAPFIKDAFELNNTQYALLASAFSIPYAIAAPAAGLLIDRLGLTRGISLALGTWSLAGIATGLGTTFGTLVACRGVLGVAEAGGIPASGKAIARFLRPEERALGHSLNQVAVSLGLMAAPPLSLALAIHFHWRAAFLVTGVLGLLWIPLWRWMDPKLPDEPASRESTPRAILRDRRLWAFAAANATGMTLYAIWTVWTVLYLVDAAGATRAQAGWLASFTALFATLGGFSGGWLSFRLMRSGKDALTARYRGCLLAGVAALATAALPWLPGPALAAAGIAVSFFAVSAFSVNIYAMPLDVFGARHAAFAVAFLTTAYGLMQAAVSPLVGWLVDHHGYTPAVVGAAVTPLAACAILRLAGLRW